MPLNEKGEPCEKIIEYIQVGTRKESVGSEKKKRPYPACRPAKVASRITKKEAAKKTGPRKVKWSVTASGRKRKKSGTKKA